MPSPYAARRPWLVHVLAVLIACVAATGAIAVRTHPARPARTAPVRRAPVRPTATWSPPPTPVHVAPPHGEASFHGAVPVTGRVVDVAGRPVAGATVRLSSSSGGFFDQLGSLFMGRSCRDQPACRHQELFVRTTADGRYTVYLDPGDTTFWLNVSRGNVSVSGVQVSAEDGPVRMPRLVLWSLAPRLELARGRARVTFARPPARLGRVVTCDVAVWDGDPAVPVVTELFAGSGVTFDARPVRGLRARLTVTCDLGAVSYSATVPFR